MNQLIDTHAHLYVEQFDEDQEQMVGRSIAAGVSKIYLPNIDESSIERMNQLCDLYPENAFPMMGLHPCSVKADFNEVLDRMEILMDERQYHGVGETGIDLYWDTSTRDWQIESFVRHIDWSKTRRLPLIIHSRSALDVTIDLVERHADSTLQGIFHCFDGSLDDAERILNTGFYLGVGGVVTYKNSKVIDVIKKIGLNRIVLETDAPYLSPVPKRGKRNESAYIQYVADFIALSLNLTREEVYETTTKNAEAIFMAHSIN